MTHDRGGDLSSYIFLIRFQRSLDDNKQGPVLMTRVTKQAVIRPRNDFIEDKQSTTRDNNNMVTKFEKMYNKQVLKIKITVME